MSKQLDVSLEILGVKCRACLVFASFDLLLSSASHVEIRFLDFLFLLDLLLLIALIEHILKIPLDDLNERNSI